MELTLVSILIIAFGGVIHSYLLYPLYLYFTTDYMKEQNPHRWLASDDLPSVDILVAAYNEEKVIADKIESVFKTTYPRNKINLYIGSDASTDLTNSIITKYQLENPQIHLVEFPGRTGKSGIINNLAEIATSPVLILSDANVIFNEGTIYHLLKHFRNEEVKQVAANIVKRSENNEGIRLQEKKYLSIENKLKHFESIKWNLVMGAEGGCYAIRKDFYSPVPPKFFMDDFYITMSVLEKNGKVLFEPEALCFEDVPAEQSEEYKRKIRISIGNFQNLARYKKLLMPPWKPLAFAFWSHKVLRWHTPFFLLILFLGLFILSFVDLRYQLVFLIYLVSLLSPLIDRLLSNMGVSIGLLRFASHFYMMNFALLHGFIKYHSGIKSNVWEPTKRS